MSIGTYNITGDGGLHFCKTFRGFHSGDWI